MILDRLPDVKKLSSDEKWKLAKELWDELIPPTDAKRDDAIMTLINERLVDFQADPSSATDWLRVKEKLAAIKQCLRS